MIDNEDTARMSRYERDVIVYSVKAFKHSNCLFLYIKNVIRDNSFRLSDMKIKQTFERSIVVEIILLRDKYMDKYMDKYIGKYLFRHQHLNIYLCAT